MNEHTPPTGLCPRCETVGKVGDACDDALCQRRRYHYVHADLVLGRLEHDPRVGKRVDKYLLLEPLGVGGFGTVYRAMNVQLGRTVALKLLTAAPDDPHREVHMRMFANEATALAQLSHPNIVHLIDAGVDDGLPYIVMEHINDAQTLRDDIEERAASRRRLPAIEARATLAAMISALEAAHARKIIHRDIKPENVMLQAVPGHGNFVRVLDFGLAKFVSDSTRTARAMGTPRYMAPEQLWARGLGPWTDLYAVGVIAFELMTGRTPFGHSPSEIVAHKRESSYDPLAVVADMPLPEAAKTFLRKALAYQPAYRHRSADELRVDFKAAYDAILSEGRSELIAVDLAGIVVNEEEDQATNALDFANTAEDAPELLPEVSGVLAVNVTPAVVVSAPQMTMPAPMPEREPERRPAWRWIAPMVAVAALLALLGFELLSGGNGTEVVHAAVPAPALRAQAERSAPEPPEPAPVVALADASEPVDAAVQPSDIGLEVIIPQLAMPDARPADDIDTAPFDIPPSVDPEAEAELAAAEKSADEARKRRANAVRRLKRAQEQLAADDLEGASALVREGLAYDSRNAELRALADVIAVDRAVAAKLVTIAGLGDPNAQWEALSDLRAPEHSVSARQLAKLRAAVAPRAVERHVQRGRDALAMGEFDQAIAAADDALAIVPGHGGARALRDSALVAQARANERAEQEARCKNDCRLANDDCETRALVPPPPDQAPLEPPCRSTFATCIAACGR